MHALGLDLQSPLTNAAVNGNCQEAPSAGYLCEKALTPLFEAFAQASGPAAQREAAGQVQAVVTEQALGVTFGQFAQPAAFRANVRNVSDSAIPLFWRVEKDQVAAVISTPIPASGPACPAASRPAR